MLFLTSLVHLSVSGSLLFLLHFLSQSQALDNVGTVHHAECLYDKGNRADHAARSALTCTHWLPDEDSDCFLAEVDDILFDTRHCCVPEFLQEELYEKCKKAALRDERLSKECLDDVCLDHVDRALTLVQEAQPGFEKCTKTKREGGEAAPVPAPCKSASDKLAEAAVELHDLGSRMNAVSHRKLQEALEKGTIEDEQWREGRKETRKKKKRRKWRKKKRRKNMKKVEKQEKAKDRKKEEL